MGVPGLSSATVAAGGKTLTLVWSEAVTRDGEGFTLAVGGRAYTPTYSSGDGSDTLIYTTAAIFNGDRFTISAPLSAVTALSTSDPSAAIVATAGTNSSKLPRPITRHRTRRRER